jgi:hypothetical protein
MLTPPSRAPLSILTDNDPKPHTGATVALIAPFTQLQHAVAQFISSSPWWWLSSRHRSRSRRPAILGRNHNPRSIASLLVARLLVVTITARPRLALRSNGSPSRAADNRPDGRPASAIQNST